MRHAGSRRRRVSIRSVLLICAICTAIGLFMLTMGPIDPSDDMLTTAKQLSSANSSSETGALVSELSSGSGGLDSKVSSGNAGLGLKVISGSGGFDSKVSSGNDGLGLKVSSGSGGLRTEVDVERKGESKSCATVEEMGEVFKDGFYEESLRVRELIRAHFDVNGAARIRDLPPEQFCKHGFVLGKASEAGFGNEMYKMLTAAALSVMLNRSLIIGQTRGRFPFDEFISYSNISFTLREVKHLWNHNRCMKKFGRELVIGADDFVKPSQSNILCSNWRKWEHPIIWLQNTTDAVAAQFFLKNVHSEMREAAASLFGHPEAVHLRPNVYGELMKILISPSPDVEEAVNWVLRDGEAPDISLHMRMLMNRSVRATHAALVCIRKAMGNLLLSKPRVVVVSDTPSFVKDIAMNLSEFAEVLQFDYKLYKGNISLNADKLSSLDVRSKDWGPSPRWVAFVDFFLASRAKYAVITGAQRRVGTTYAQLIAGLSAANNMAPGDESRGSKFLFLSSFQSNLLAEGLSRQVGWGHVWNRYAGPLSCHGQPHQCAFTPLLPSAWYDDLWQSPIPRDIRRLGLYGIKLTSLGTIDQDNLLDFCSVKKRPVKTLPAFKSKT